MKNLKFVLMGLFPRHKKCLKKDGLCKMGPHGLEITPETIQE
jgi:hypothetical protein